MDDPTPKSLIGFYMGILVITGLKRHQVYFMGNLLYI